MTMVEMALKYIDRGLAVFPVTPGDKPPLGSLAPSGVKDATTDKGQVQKWWGKQPNANIGVATGSFFAIDLDMPDGPETWFHLTDDKEVPTTTQVKTPSGGRHFYFHAPDSVEVKNSVSSLGDGIDVRGHGGYVIAPPSKVDGDSYKYAVKEPIADAPNWLLSEVLRQKTESSVSKPDEVPDTIPKGQRNDKLASFAGYLRHKGLTYDEVLPALKAFNQNRCDPPIGSLRDDGENEVQKIAKSVCNYDPSEAVKVRGADDLEASQQQKEIARHLCTVLHECPEYGPVVKNSLPDAEVLPSPFDNALGEMMDAGLPSGEIDVAKLSLNGSAEAIQNPDFDVGRFKGGDKVSQVLSWADDLRMNAKNREMAKDLGLLADEIAKSDESPSKMFSTVINRARQHTEDASSEMVWMEDAAKQALNTVQKWKQGITADTLHTWPTVDDKIGGLKAGQMTVIGGFTSGFKTASLVDLARRVALRDDEDKVIPLFSAEMDSEDISHRMAANDCGIPPNYLRPDRNGNVEASAEEFDRYEGALDRLSNLKIVVDPHPNPTYDRMLSHCLQLQAQGEISFIGFDYLEKMQESGNTEELRVSSIAQRLKRLAKELGSPVVVLSQYGRQKHSHKRFPSNQYLRYSGKIEQEAHTILHWWYPKYFVDRERDENEVKKWNPADPNAIYAICTKNRDGPILNAKLHINEKVGRFIDKYDDDDASPQDQVPF